MKKTLAFALYRLIVCMLWVSCGPSGSSERFQEESYDNTGRYPAECFDENDADSIDSCTVSDNSVTVASLTGEDFFNQGIEYEKEDNYAEAIKAYKTASEMGNIDATYNLGVLYDHGRGVKEDVEQAFRLYKQAEEANDAWGQNAVGRCYYYGRGTEKNEALGLQYIRKAAAQGFGPAKQFLVNLSASESEKAADPCELENVAQAPTNVSSARVDNIASTVKEYLKQSNSLQAYNALSRFVRNNNLDGDECMQCFALSSDIAQGFSGQFMSVTMNIGMSMEQKNIIMQNINNAISANNTLGQQLLKAAAQQGNQNAINALIAMGIQVASAPSLSSSSSSSSTGRSSESSSGHDVTLRAQDQNTYWNWAKMIRDMRLGNTTFNARKLREYQSNMKNIRRRWQEKSLGITYSEEEDWRP